jgi:glycosyltransferase involved in cell wall biosynthesis
MRARGLLSRWQERAAARRGCLYEGYDQTDAAFARKVASLDLPEHDVFFGYSYASFEALEAEKRRGRLTIVDQIDPGPVEFRIVAEEMREHPELAGPPLKFPSNHFDRARREWELADIIVVNSEWSRDAIISEGADPAKIEILPLAYEAEEVQSAKSTKRTGNLKVLWLGQVNVRKGIHYLLEAARLLEREAVEFLIAGPIQIRPFVVETAPKNVRWLGPIPRNQVRELYEASDVFVLPTLSDGFAITQIEALAHGLPIIVTPRCGRVVEDGVTGFLIPPKEPTALVNAILKFVKDRRLAPDMSQKCTQICKTFSIAAYGNDLLQIIGKHLARNEPVRLCEQTAA